MTMKMIENLYYTEIHEGQPEDLKPIRSFKAYMNVKVNGGGSNIVDYVLKNDDTFIPFSVKYMEEYNDTNVHEIATTFNEQGLKVKVGLFVRDRKLVIEHEFNNRNTG